MASELHQQSTALSNEALSHPIVANRISFADTGAFRILRLFYFDMVVGGHNSLRKPSAMSDGSRFHLGHIDLDTR